MPVKIYKSVFLFFITTILATNTLDAQTAADSVKIVINRMFTGMKNSDTALVKSCFAREQFCKPLAKIKLVKL